MMITAKLLKLSLSEHRLLTTAAKTLFRSSSYLTETGGNTGSLHTSCCQYAGAEWRKKRGQPANPNAYGPLTDGPDYSYLDGRPTPVGYGKLLRASEQKEITSKIMKLSSEVDFAVAHDSVVIQKEKERREKIIKNKLKSKGNLPPEVIS